MSKIFDSRDTEYKSPFGAAVCGATVRFAVRPGDENVTGVTLLLRREFAGTEQEVALSPGDDGRWQGVYTAPEEPESGSLWLDTGGEKTALRQYGQDGWTEVDDVCVGLHAAGIGVGFRAGDGVSVSGCREEALNGSFQLRAAEEDCVMVSLVVAFLIILLIGDPFKGLIYSQMILSIQLPFTVFLQVHLTSSERVKGKYRNSRFTKYLLYGIGAVVTVLNVMLLVSFFR